MLIGAHVSNAGGLPKAVERGLERECDAIQIFNQNPRAWKPREYPGDEVEAFSDLVFLKVVDGAWSVQLVGRYADVLRNEDGRWRFAARVLTFTTL